MAYALQPDEPVEQSVRRIAGELLDRSLRTLQREEPNAAHQIRKSCKKIRALLRLVRKPLGATFAEENRWYRDFARQLAGVRDAQAVVEAWRELRQGAAATPSSARIAGAIDDTRLPAFLSDDRQAAIETMLEQRRDRLATQRAPDSRALAHHLRTARHRSTLWRLDREGFAALSPGLARAYKRARGLMRSARLDCPDGALPDPALFHEWRKRTKDHWYHMRLVRLVVAQPLLGREDALSDLGELLGHHHDLQMLRAALRELDLGGDEAGTIEAVIEKTTAVLVGACYQLGEDLFAAKARAFVDSLHGEGRLRRHEQRALK